MIPPNYDVEAESDRQVERLRRTLRGVKLADIEAMLEEASQLLSAPVGTEELYATASEAAELIDGALELLDRLEDA